MRPGCETVTSLMLIIFQQQRALTGFIPVTPQPLTNNLMFLVLIIVKHHRCFVFFFFLSFSCYLFCYSSYKRQLPHQPLQSYRFSADCYTLTLETPSVSGE